MLSNGLLVLISHIAIGDKITTYLNEIVQELFEYNMNTEKLLNCLLYTSHRGWNKINISQEMGVIFHGYCKSSELYSRSSVLVAVSTWLKRDVKATCPHTG